MYQTRNRPRTSLRDPKRTAEDIPNVNSERTADDIGRPADDIANVNFEQTADNISIVDHFTDTYQSDIDSDVIAGAMDDDKGTEGGDVASDNGDDEDTEVALHYEYLKGLDNMRKIVTKIVADTNSVATTYYGNATGSRTLYEASTESSLVRSRASVHDDGVSVDSDVTLVSLLNRLRQVAEDNSDVADDVALLTDFCSRLRVAIESLDATRRRFESCVLSRLRAGCDASCDVGCDVSCDVGCDVSCDVGCDVSCDIGHDVGYDISCDVDCDVSCDVSDVQRDVANEGSEPELTRSYRQRCGVFQTTIARALAAVADMHADYMRAPAAPKRARFADSGCGGGSVTQVFSTACAHLTVATTMARSWLDADEAYMRDIEASMGLTRRRTRQLKRHMSARRRRQTCLEGDVHAAHALFRANQSALATIVSELDVVELEVNECALWQRHLTDERRQKKGIAGFLERGMAARVQTQRRNGSLQLKRSRIARQLRELEASLLPIERHLAALEAQLSSAAGRKGAASERLQDSSAAYRTLDEHLRLVNAHVHQLHKEVTQLTRSLAQLETIHAAKTSPENVDDFYERPSTVKLAPSLKEKIRRRKEAINV